VDKIPLNTHQTLAFFFPGLVFAFSSFYSYYFSFVEHGTIETFFKHYKDDGIAVFFVLLGIAIVAGLIFDSIRNGILEELFDKKKKIRWDFFFDQDTKIVGMLYARYYNYYVYDINTVIALFFSAGVLITSLKFHNMICLLIVQLCVIIILCWEAFRLRGEISKITHKFH
jgi:hypothetical protein